MNILKKAQTQPIFSVYQNKISTRHNFSIKKPISICEVINLQDDQVETITLDNNENYTDNSVTTSLLTLNSDNLFSSPKPMIKKKQKTNSLVNDSDNETTLWPNSIIKSLISYLSDNMSLYRLNKEKFYLKAALYLGKGKTGLQVHNKIRSLIDKYMAESSNKTGKGTSTWAFYSEMNDIFGNRENMNSDYIVNSTDEEHYVKSIDLITKSKRTEAESKKIEAETKQQLLKLEKKKFKFEQKKWEHEKEERIILE
ncbi:3111_t:CDS:2, partial [Scutellospora calospora]